MATILVVDDHALNRQFLLTLLGYGGHRLLEAADGVEALKLARAEHPDLMITDILMPRMDGHELVTRMRADPALAGTPVIFYTATYRVREARSLALDCGVQWVLAKPSDPETILKATQEALNLPAAADTPATEEAPAPKQDLPAAIGDRFIAYLGELETAANQISRLSKHGRAFLAEQDNLRRLSQGLVRTLGQVQALGLRLTSLVELGLDLLSERDPAILVQTCCKAARNICVAKYAAIGIPKDGGEGLREFVAFGFGDAAEASPAWPPPASGLLATLIQEGVPRRLSGLDVAPQALGLPADHSPAHALIWVPIASPERSYGWLYLANKLGDMEFSESDEQMALTIVTQFAVAYENLLLHALGEGELLSAMCRTVVNEGGYRMAWIGLVEQPIEGKQVIRLAAGAAAEECGTAGWEPGAIVAEDAACPAFRAIRDGLPRAVPDILLSDAGCACQRELRGAGASRSVIALPLKHGGKPFGVLTIYDVEPGAFDAEQIPLLEELADDIAYGVTSLREQAARHRAEHALHIARFSLDHAAGAILRYDQDARIDYANESACRLFGYMPEEMDRLAMADLSPGFGEEEWQQFWAGLKTGRSMVLRSECRTRAGKTFPVEITTNFFAYGDRGFGFAYLQDISERLAAEDRIRYLANFDSLTGLPNRTLLLDRMEQTLRYAERYGLAVGVLFADMDRFKLVNDTFGHACGDELLKDAARRFGECVRDTDTVARVGGDEFVVVIPDQDEGQGTALVTRRIVEHFARPFALGEHDLIVTCSIGLSEFPKDGRDAEILLRNADMAMYRAKESGRNTYQFFAPDMNAELAERVVVEQALRGALPRGEFLLHYQPQVDLTTGRIVGVEALIRWQRAGVGTISPNQFIPIAEDAGLIGGIGKWALRTAGAQCRAWLERGLPPLRMAVNLSALQFRNAGFPQQVAAILQDFQLRPECLEIELTESMLVPNAEAAIEIMRALKAMGVRLSLDDFGTGYSSPSCLRRFPIDTLKIDQSFVRSVDSNSDHAAIATAVIAMAHSMNLGVVAEGVETQSELEFLIVHGCDLMQGHYFSKPLPPEQIESLLRQGRFMPMPGGS